MFINYSISIICVVFDINDRSVWSLWVAIGLKLLSYSNTNCCVHVIGTYVLSYVVHVIK